jgi:putative transposase
VPVCRDELGGRRVLAWHLSDTLTTNFFINAVEEAIHSCGKPEILNND